MSVATEFSPTVFVDALRNAVQQVESAPGERPRLRLVPPAPGTSRAGAARRGNLRVGRRGYLVPVGSDCTAAARRVEQIDGAGAAPRPVRLTRRGVVALAAMVVLLGGLMLLVAHLSLGSPAAPAGAAPGSVVTVRAGDTLWSIAGQVAPGRDPRQVVERLREVNHLASTALTPGQTLKVG